MEKDKSHILFATDRIKAVYRKKRDLHADRNSYIFPFI